MSLWLLCDRCRRQEERKDDSTPPTWLRIEIGLWSGHLCGDCAEAVRTGILHFAEFREKARQNVEGR